MSTCGKLIVLSAACVLFCGCVTSRPVTIYVNGAAGDNGGDGLSEACALKTIQRALNLAGDGDTILVADGIYSGEGNKDLDFRGKKVHLKSAGGPDKCVIDCENDGRAFLFHCNETKASVVEGFTLANGNVNKGRPTTTFDFLPDGVMRGGAVLCICSSPAIRDCTFKNNRANRGGAIYCYKSSPSVSNCRFRSNKASEGAAVSCVQESSAVITQCLVTENEGRSTAMVAGGYVIHCRGGSNAVITGCTIARNQGAGICSADSSLTISDCEVSGCREDEDDLWGAGSTSGIALSGGRTQLTRCKVTHNSGCGIAHHDGTARLTDCVVSNNGEHGVEASKSELIVKDCRIEGNRYIGVDCGKSNVEIVSSIVTNSSESIGISFSDSKGKVANSLISGNRELGIECANSSQIDVLNCTIAGNSGPRGLGVCCGGDCRVTVTNTIIWGNADPEENEVHADRGGSLTLKYCLLREFTDTVWETKPGAGVTLSACLHAEPQFLDAAGGNYRLKPGSPAIDAGLNSFAPRGVKTDLDGKPRIVDSNGDSKAVVDIGAYEYHRR